MLSTTTLLLALTLGPNPVFRSVGSHAGPVAAGGNGSFVTVAAGVATFTQPLPDIAGVGDALVYDTTGDGTPNAIAFLHRRNSAFEFNVERAGSGTPPDAEATTSWTLYRAYRTLADAVNVAVRPGLPLGGTENPDIDAPLRNFDTWSGGSVLTSSGRQYHFACYADSVDDSLVWIGPPWSTDKDHHLEIFTPWKPTEVGVSQRHAGVWGTGYQRTSAIHVDDLDVWIDGLAIKQSRPPDGADGGVVDSAVFSLHTGHRGSVMRVSNCLGWAADSTPGSPARAFEVVEDLAFDAGTTQVRAWNDLGVTDVPGPGRSAAFATDTSDDVAFLNCTGVATAGAAAFLSDDTAASATAANVIGSLGTSDGGAAVALSPAAAPWTMSFTAVGDSSLDATTCLTPAASNFPGSSFSFRGPGDYHLAAGDMGAVGLGVAPGADAGVTFDTDFDGQPRGTQWDLGADQLQPQAAPEVTTVSATVQDDGSVTLTGNATAHNLPTHAWFRFGTGTASTCDDAVGTRVPSEPGVSGVYVGQDDHGVSFSWSTPVLNDGTYWACAFAQNAEGLAVGAPVPFELARPPRNAKVLGPLTVGCDCGTPGDPLWVLAALAALGAWRQRSRQGR